MKTKYVFLNSGELSEKIEIAPISNVGTASIHLNGEEILVHIKDKSFVMDIHPGDDVEVCINTKDSFVKINRNTTLRAVIGPIEYNENLDDYFIGCMGLTSISDNVFSRNSHITVLSRTFKDCVMLDPHVFNFLEPLVNLEVLDETFSNTGIVYLNSKTFKNVSNIKPKVFKSTFKNCIELSSVAINTFDGMSIKNLDNTFTGCLYLKSIHPEFFYKLSKGIELKETFKNTGIKHIDSNLESYLPEYVRCINIFSGCDINELNQYK